jgi:nucleoside-triphosphatase THEP1
MSEQREIWLKAAVIGSLWGASEIVLGSFLHNLRIPFSGNLLTAIGIILMISGHRLWPERGLLIRAGLICAALKSLSPSPVILGPMISIFMQASLMEASLLAGRRYWAGYLLGAGLAMSWNLLFRILSTLVLYGSPVIDLYQQLVTYLFSQTGWQFSGYWAPIFVLGGLFFIFGVVAGVAGLMVSRAAARNVFSRRAPAFGTVPPPAMPRMTRSGKWKILFPLGFLILLVAGLYSIRGLPLLLSTALLAVFLLLVRLHDPALVRRFFKKKGFWIGLSAMVILSGLLLGKPAPGIPFSPEGLRIGWEMCLRALYVITGFGILSMELRNPSLVRWFENRHMDQFLSAVRIAFQTTPLVIETIPGKAAWRKPGRVLTDMVRSMEYSLEYMRSRGQAFSQVFIITGKKGAGKTTLAERTTKTLLQHGLAVKGFLAPEWLENGQRAGYRIQDVVSGENMLLCRRREKTAASQPGPFYFYPEALEFGERLLAGNEAGYDRNSGTERHSPPGRQMITVVDELGPFELQGLGWAAAMDSLHRNSGPLLLVVRESLVEPILQRWPAARHRIYHARETRADELAAEMIREMQT